MTTVLMTRGSTSSSLARVVQQQTFRTNLKPPATHPPHKQQLLQRMIGRCWMSSTNATTPVPPSHAPPQSQKPPPSKLRQLTRQYGPVAIVVYVALSTCTFWLTFLALWNGVDLERVVDKTKKQFGYSTKGDDHDDNHDDKETPKTSNYLEFMEQHPINMNETNDTKATTTTTTTTPLTESDQNTQQIADLAKQEWSWNRLGGTLALAFVLNKLWVPLKLPMVVLLTPRIARTWPNLMRRNVQKQSMGMTKSSQTASKAQSKTLHQ
jgi:hypothetical protein